MRNKKGFTLIELAIGIGLLAILIMAVSVGVAGIRDNAKVQNASQSVNALHVAAENYIAAGNSTFTGISVAVLQTGNFLPAGLTAATANPWGGSYTVSANASDSSKVDIALASVPSAAATRLSALYANSAGATGYVGTTWTVTF